MELLNAIKPIYLALLGLGLVTGLVSGGTVGRAIWRMVWVPIAFAFGFSAAKAGWSALAPAQQLGTMCLGPIALLVVLLVGTRFGREVLAEALGELLADALRALIRMMVWGLTLPFRLFVRLRR